MTVSRAFACIGKVTSEISQRSTVTRRRLAPPLPRRASLVRKPIDRPSIAPRRRQRRRLSPTGRVEGEFACDLQPDAVLGDRDPAADRPCRIVLPEHANLACPPANQRGGEGAGLDPVAGQIDLPENRGVARKARRRWHRNGCDQRGRVTVTHCGGSAARLNPPGHSRPPPASRPVSGIPPPRPAPRAPRAPPKAPRRRRDRSTASAPAHRDAPRATRRAPR